MLVCGVSVISCRLANPAVRRQGWRRPLQHVQLGENRVGFTRVAGSKEKDYSRQHDENRRQRNFPDGFAAHDFPSKQWSSYFTTRLLSCNHYVSVVWHIMCQGSPLCVFG